MRISESGKPLKTSELSLTVIMNSGVESVFAAKCCAIPDANLEIIVTNTANRPITVNGGFELSGTAGTQPLNLYPQGERVIEPDEGAAFYASMDPQRWSTWQTLSVTDTSGREHHFDLDAFTN